MVCKLFCKRKKKIKNGKNFPALERSLCVLFYVASIILKEVT